MSEYTQFQLLLIFAICGIVIGIIIGLLNLFLIICKNNKAIKTILDTFVILLTTIVFIFITNTFNLGQIRAYLAITFLLGIFLERKTIGKLFAKLYLRLYNLIKEKWRIFSNTKFGRMLKR